MGAISDGKRARGVQPVPGKTSYEAAIRGWKTAQLAEAAGISPKTALKALRDQRIDVPTAMAIGIAFAQTRDDIKPELREYFGHGPTEAA